MDNEKPAEAGKPAKDEHGMSEDEIDLNLAGAFPASVSPRGRLVLITTMNRRINIVATKAEHGISRREGSSTNQDISNLPQQPTLQIISIECLTVEQLRRGFC